MCQMEARMEPVSQQVLFNPETSSANMDHVFGDFLPSTMEKNPVLVSPSESGKKKRVQRAAKLKQFKMDVRREQWLAQVSGKVSKVDSCASSRSSSQDDREDKELLLQASPGEIDMGTLDNKECREDLHPKQSSTLCSGDREMWSGSPFLDDSHRGVLPVNYIKEKPLCCSQIPGCANCTLVKDLGEKEAERKTGDGERPDVRGFTSMWSTSDTSSSHSNSGQVSSSSDDENDVEDWETVADALHVKASVEDVKLVKQEAHCQAPNRPLDKNGFVKSISDMDKCVLKPESMYRPGNCGSRSRADSGRAWRPDDVLRPPTLPCLSKQRSFPLQSVPLLWSTSQGKVWGLPPPPSHCPICTEELDTTDSLFLPCSCGFRLCLFCHNKILVGDGRCPGCRKSYNSEAALKLSRNASVRPRV